MSIENIAFTKIDLSKFSDKDYKDFIYELKRRKIRFRVQNTNVYFDCRFDKQIKDLLPKHY